jgi:hypothetical protein
MKQNYSVTCVGLALFALAGCVTPQAPAVLSMTYHSDPEGASLYEGARLWGYTPMTLTYPSGRSAFARNECLCLNPTQVRWASGVNVAVTNLQTCPATGALVGRYDASAGATDGNRK